MAERKNQHYVPQFYLRGFSSEPGRKRVGTFHIPSRRYIDAAPIRGQASAKDFYGVPEIEDTLGEIEGWSAPVLARMIDSGECPTPLSEDHVKLAIFLAFLAQRTPTGAASANEFLDTFFQSWATFTEFRDDAPAVAARYTKPAARAVSTTAKVLPDVVTAILDLEMQVVRLDAAYGLLTSDTPLVRYNQYLERRGHQGASTGWPHRGLQVFLPLSPTRVLYAYDPDVYSIGDGGGRLLDVERPDDGAADVRQLNVLQAVEADNSLYFDPATASHEYVEIILRAATRWRIGQKEPKVTWHRVLDAPVDGDPGWVVQNVEPEARLGLRLSFTRERDDVRDEHLPSRTEHLRPRFEPPPGSYPRVKLGPARPRPAEEEIWPNGRPPDASE